MPNYLITDYYVPLESLAQEIFARHSSYRTATSICPPARAGRSRSTRPCSGTSRTVRRPNDGCVSMPTKGRRDCSSEPEKRGLRRGGAADSAGVPALPPPVGQRARREISKMSRRQRRTAQARQSLARPGVARHAAPLPVMWGVMKTFGSWRIGLSTGIGSGSKTSRPAVMSPRLSRSISAAESTTAPRETLTNTEPDGSRSSSGLPSMPRVAGVSGTRQTTTSVARQDPVQRRQPHPEHVRDLFRDVRIVDADVAVERTQELDQPAGRCSRSRSSRSSFPLARCGCSRNRCAAGPPAHSRSGGGTARRRSRPQFSINASAHSATG